MARILLVEDNQMNRDMLSRRLTRKGFEVQIAVDGWDGITKAHSESPHLILMDLRMPEMDGFEAVKFLKAEEATRSIPIIVLTACVLARDKERALEAGVDDFDIKPIQFSRLVEKIHRLLARGNDQ